MRVLRQVRMAVGVKVTIPGGHRTLIPVILVWTVRSVKRLHLSAQNDLEKSLMWGEGMREVINIIFFLHIFMIRISLFVNDEYNHPC